jgi:septum formation protein
VTWLNRTDRLLLASASPRRLALLQQLQIPTEQLMVPSPPGEDEPRLANEAVQAYVCRTAHDKLVRAMAHLRAQVNKANADPHPQTERAILTADTTVALGQEILGKPVDDEHARGMLHTLSGQTHEVYTAVYLHWQGHTRNALSISRVRFGALTPEQIEAYIQTKEPQGKAGAYAIQGIGGRFVQDLQGSFSAVVGLPIYETTQLLSQAGLMK